MKRHRRHCGEDGFTLVEILIVLVILAVLAAIIVPSFAGRTEQARRSKAVADIQNISVALEMYEADNGAYPTTDMGLQALVERPDESAAPNWNGPYLKKSAFNDPWGRPYQYLSPGQHNPDAYDLYSFGKDGREGGEGNDADITNWEEH